LVPVFLKLKNHFPTSPKARNILHKASMSLLRESISKTYHDVNSISRKLYQLHLELSNILHPTFFQRVDSITVSSAEEHAFVTSAKQKQKFEHLMWSRSNTSNYNQTVPTLDPKKVVFNHSKHELSEVALKVLSKGLNYAIAPNRIPYKKIICGVESSILHLSKESAEIIRQDTTSILRKAKPPAPNISKEEIAALKELKENTSIVIVPADKGNATVVMDEENYRLKMNKLLDDPAYVTTKQDPTVYLEKKTRSLILDVSSIDDKIKRLLIPREKSSRVPRLYGLPKIHKKDIPLRPIVSAVKSPTQALARYLAKILQPLTEVIPSYVKNSSHFVNRLQDFKIDHEDIMVSFDVVSLFTRVPVNEVMTFLDSNDLVPKYVVELTKHCMASTYFIYDKKFYKQISGAPMGSPLSPVVANLFMQEFETKAISSSILKPKCWLRYVDDVFTIWQHGQETLPLFLDHLNSLHKDIQFTMDVEKNGRFPFLDVDIIRKPNNTLGHTVYRKPTHTNRYLHASSHHHPAQIRSVAYTLATRSRRIADEENLQSELKILTDALVQNGFPHKLIQKAINRIPNSDNQNGNVGNEMSQEVLENQEEQEVAHLAFLPYVCGVTDRISRLLKEENIKTIFDTDRKLGTLIRNCKDNINLEGWGVYEVPCKECPHTYIGQSGRNCFQRLQEHRLAVKNDTKSSALAQHVRDTKHAINFDGMKIISLSDRLQPRLVREAIEISVRPHCLNKQIEAERLPLTWTPILSQLKIHPSNPIPVKENISIDQHQTSSTQSTQEIEKRITRSMINPP
jgi:hypothetical protein